MDNITIGAAINSVQELYSKGVKSRDSRLSARYIYSLLLKNRATVLKQQINKGQSISQWTYQPIRCMQLESITTNFTDGKLLRTVSKVPTPIVGLNSSTLNNVTSIDGTVRFDITTFENLKYSVGKKYTANKPSIYIQDQRIYVNYTTKLKGISIRGLFYDPIEVINYPSLCSDCTDCNCKDVQQFSFPLDGDTLNSVIRLSTNDLILFMQSKEDKFNNASDDSELGNQMIHQPQQQQGED